MGKPRLIILIRHAQSEGNKNKEIHQTTPDHRVKLTAEGRKQASEAGRKLRSLLRPDDTLHFYTSPYRRTRETTEGILSELTSDEPTPSPFPRHTIKVYEEPRLREQDFGNFQPSSAEMARMWRERAEYGHFFYRIPNGESAADAYDRVSGFNESLWRSFGEDDFASVCVLVTHGLMTRVFLMKWYHFSVEYFEDLRNINHCEFIVMKRGDSGKYILQNHLRTWTEYKIEKAEELRRARRNGGDDSEEDAAKSKLNSPIPPRTRWRGCADDELALGPRRQNTADMFRDDGVVSMAQLNKAMSSKSMLKQAVADGDDADETQDDGLEMKPSLHAKDTHMHPAMARRPPSLLNSPHLGRDGGGSESGQVSADEDDDSASTSTANQIKTTTLPFRPGGAPTRISLIRPDGGSSAPSRTAMATAMQIARNSGAGAIADALGDQSDLEEEEEQREITAEVNEEMETEGSFARSVR